MTEVSEARHRKDVSNCFLPGSRVQANTEVKQLKLERRQQSRVGGRSRMERVGTISSNKKATKTLKTTTKHLSVLSSWSQQDVVRLFLQGLVNLKMNFLYRSIIFENSVNFASFFLRNTELQWQWCFSITVQVNPLKK